MPNDNRTREELLKEIEDLRHRLENAEASLHALRCGATEMEYLERAAQEKNQVEERLRYALEAGNIGAWDLDLMDHTAYRSLEHDRIFGYDTLLPEWTYEAFLNHVLPEERDKVDATFRTAMASQGDWDFTCRIRRADGEVRWIWASGCHCSDEASNRRRMAGVVRDITDYKYVQQAVQVSETRYRLLFESSLEAIFTLDCAGRLLLANPASERISGYSPEELTNKNFADLCAPDLLPAAQAAFLDVLNGAPREIETAMISKHGRRVELLVSGAPMIEDGSVRGIFCLAIDITARKLAEETLRRYELLAGHSRDIILFMELDSGQILEVNAAAITTYGYTREELLERTINDLRAYETRDVTATQMAESANRGIQFETVHRRKDGSMFPVEVSSQGALIGRAQTLISVVRDITERKQGEAYRSMGQDILLALNENENQKEAIKRVIDIIKSATGVDAVGIRLQDEDDFPYFYQEGFPQDFLLKENSLLTRTKDGGICRDECGDICLECTCGLVVTCKTDPTNPLFTKGGSSWTNDSFPFLHVPVDEDIRTNPRNECIHQGFASVALIPIRAKGRVVGLLQLNDRRKGCFTLEGIETLEKIAENVGESMLRKQAEEALRESEEQFRALADSIPSFAWRANSDGYITWYNQRWYEYTGTTPEQMEGWGWQSVHDPDELPEVLERWQASIATGEPFDMTFSLRGADGAFRPFLTRVIPLKNADGRVQQWFGTNTDVSELKRVEEALRESERCERERAEELAVLFEAVPTPVFIARDPDCLHLTGNHLANEILRISRGNELSLSGPPETRPCHFRTFKDGRELRLDELPAQRAARGDHVKDFEFSLVFDDGMVRHVLGYGTPLLDNQGCPRGTVAVLVDITARKQAEEALRRQSEAALLLSEQEFRSLAEAMPQIVWATRPDGWNIYFNQQWVDYTGLTMEESYGHGWNTPFHPDDKQRAWDAWQRATQYNERYSLECRLRRADGAYRWWLVRGEPMRGANGEILKWFGTCTDIEELKHAETVLHEANTLLEQRVTERTAALQASVAEKEVMLKEIHHRVKNNLQIISSLIGLQADGSKDETIRQVLRDVIYRVRSMALVHEKLYQSDNLAHIDFAEYMRSLLSYLWRAHGAAAAAVRLSLDLEQVTLPADTAVTFGLILNELAVNALEHAFQGRADGEVTFSLQSGTDRQIRLCVADNGVGLPVGFDWLQTQSLGLRLVLMLSRQLDASVEVIGGNGTRFEMVFGCPDSSSS